MSDGVNKETVLVYEISVQENSPIRVQYGECKISLRLDVMYFSTWAYYLVQPAVKIM